MSYKSKQDNELFLICDCGSYEHQAFFYFDHYDKEISVSFHLVKRSFFKRLKYAFLYILGRKSNYGAWDSFLMNKEDERDLMTFLIANSKNF